jgi:hypothetical protein
MKENDEPKRIRLCPFNRMRDCLRDRCALFVSPRYILSVGLVGVCSILAISMKLHHTAALLDEIAGIIEGKAK